MDPIDQTHADCLVARDQIRRQVALKRFHVSVWRPRPMPEGWQR
jgi:hypothetical protein